jgi:hypothetical protein
MDATKKITETVIDASKEVGLGVNTEKTKCMLLSRHQNAGQNYDIKRANRSFGNVPQFKCLGTTATNQNLIQEEIKRSLNSCNACYHSVQKLLCSRLLSKNLKVRAYKTTILPVVMYVCETWSLILRELFESRVLRRIFGPKSDEVTENWRKLHNEELHNLYSSSNKIRIKSQEG